MTHAKMSPSEIGAVFVLCKKKKRWNINETEPRGSNSVPRDNNHVILNNYSPSLYQVS